MKRLLQLGFVLGLAGTLAAGYLVPWFEYTRYRTAASVVANGGRVEQFVVHLPADRIEYRDVMAGAPDGTRLEHYKLRDADGNVIGLAVRHEVLAVGGRETAWLLTIPSRGTIALAATEPRARSIDSIVAANGLAPGQSIDRPLSIDFAAPSLSVAATGEFDGIEFELVETWLVAGIEDDGEMRGTLLLNTVGRRST